MLIRLRSCLGAGRGAGAKSLAIAGAVFCGLSLWLNRGVLGYCLATPDAWGPEPLAHLAWAVLWPLGLAAGTLAGTRCVGGLVLGRILEEDQGPDWRVLLELALGLSCLSYTVMALGLLGFFQGWILRALTLALCALGGVHWLLRRKPPVGGSRESRGAWAAAAMGLLAYLALNSVVRALAPPTGIDVLKYHLALPKLYLASGRVDDIPWQVFSHWPQFMEMLYSMGLAFASDGTSALLHTGLCAALIALTYLLAREESSPAAALASAGLLAVQPMLQTQAGEAMTDGALALFYLLACACLRRWDQEQDRRWLRAAGLMAGTGAAVKFHGAILLAGLAAWVLIRSRRGKTPGRALSALTFLAWAAILAAPWYLKAWVRAGNPVWPFLSGFFGGRWGVESVAAWVSPPASGPRLVAPEWALFGEGGAFLLLPAAAMGWALLRGGRVPRIVALALAPAPLYLLIAGTSISVWRYMMPFYAPLAIGAGWALDAMRLSSATSGRGASPLAGSAARQRISEAALPRVIARSAAACLLALGLWPIGRASHNNELFPVLGLRSRQRPELSAREAYLVKAIPAHDFIRAVNARLGPGDRALLVAENRGYYLDAPYMLGDPSDQGIIRFAAAAGPPELLGRLRECGITHLAISYDDNWYTSLMRRLDPRTYALIDETARRYGTKVLDMGRWSLYALASPGSTPLAPVQQVPPENVPACVQTRQRQ